MLFWADNGNEVTEVVGEHRSLLQTGEDRLSKEECQAIVDFINTEIDKQLESTKDSDKRVYVPGWHAPSDWAGTPLQVIYDKAFPGDFTLSAYWYGLITMQAIVDRQDSWYAWKTQFAGRDFAQNTYWVKD